MRLIGSLLLAVSLTGCAATIPAARGPQDLAVPPDFVADYRPDPGQADNWWVGFRDPALNALIEDALADNLGIVASRARLEAAESLLRAERSDRLPSIDGSANAGLEITGGESMTTASAGIAALFNPDISGRLSAEIQAAAASALAADYVVADARRLVAASVADQYIELRRTGSRLALLDQSTELQERTLRIVTLRFEAGLSANLDVRRAAADLARTRAQRGLLELQRAQAANALAVLTGQPPAPVPPPEEDVGIPNYAGGPPRGTPADLLRRRPDLLVAEAELVEAAALIGIERADLLPSLTIPGQIFVGDGSIGGFFSEFILTIGAALDLPLFDGGRRRAEIAAAEAEAEARFADYRQQFLEVLAETENALVSIEAFSSRNTDLVEAIEQSETAFSQSNALYREGLTTLFDVLDAQRQLISSREALIDSEAALASSIVALYAAIGSPSPDGTQTPYR